MKDESLQIFADEAGDLLNAAEQALLNLADTDNFDETINDLFRSFHTMKGAAGLFGFNTIVDFTHGVESLLDNAREGLINVDDDMISLLLMSRDHLDQLVSTTLSGQSTLDDKLQQTDDELTARLNEKLTPTTQPTTEPTAPNDAQSPSMDDTQSANSVNNDYWHISLVFGSECLRNGMDPAAFIQYLAKLGEILKLSLHDETIPLWSAFNPEDCYLGFEIELLAPDTPQSTIEEVFEFVQDDCEIHILPLPAPTADGALDRGLDKQNDEIESSNSPPQDDTDSKKQSGTGSLNNKTKQTIRVNALKLENLVNLVGELVISSANSELNARKMGDPNLNEAMENLLRLVEEVRDTTLGLRMVQIGDTFNRYKRVVRDVSMDTGKDIELHINGGETEFDKTLIEKMGDPLMHLVRNAIDHGIEPPDERAKAGKPAKGNVSLDAFHDSGSVVIQVSDDGGGLNKEKILRKAQDNGIIDKKQTLSDQAIYQLIFEAGFSTADSVSNLSGRGVGMDVVRRNMEMLRGQIEITSEQGVGTTISIRLPLTLAIIDGFQVRVGESQYIVPLDMVDECMELPSASLGRGDNENYINLRGKILPYMHLRALFGVEPLAQNSHSPASELDIKHRDNIVVVQFAGKKAGIVVDELLGEHQTVIKPLGKVFQHLRGISGATILGSGEVAMIIDIPEMVNRIVDFDAQKQVAS